MNGDGMKWTVSAADLVYGKVSGDVQMLNTDARNKAAVTVFSEGQQDWKACHRFCQECGAVMVEYEVEPWPKFDPLTGERREAQRIMWRCSQWTFGHDEMILKGGWK